MPVTNFEHYLDFEDQCCHDLDGCRKLGCGAAIAIAPGCAFDDLGNIQWDTFALPKDLLSFNLNTTADVETYKVIGGCDNRCKVTGRGFDLDGEFYFCEEDAAHCRMCLEGNCFSFAFLPCGVGRVYDVSGDIPDDVDVASQSGVIVGQNQFWPAQDPIAEGYSAFFGTAIVNSCGISVTPDDYITVSISATGCGRLYRENMCASVGPDGLADGDGPDGGNPIGSGSPEA